MAKSIIKYSIVASLMLGGTAACTNLETKSDPVAFTNKVLDEMVRLANQDGEAKITLIRTLENGELKAEKIRPASKIEIDHHGPFIATAFTIDCHAGNGDIISSGEFPDIESGRQACLTSGGKNIEFCTFPTEE